MRRIPGLIVLLLAGCLLISACSESDDLDGADGDDDSTETTVSTEESDEGDDPGDAGDGDEDVADAVALLEDQGLSAELAECAVDALLDQGYDTSELSQIADPDEEMLDALALAGGECVEFAGGLPEGSFDASDPAVRQGFITAFSASSGLSEEVAGCVLDYMIENDVDVQALISSSGAPSPELEQVIQDAVQLCA